MTGADENIRYRRGDNPDLDKKFTLSKKINLFAGNAVANALSETEAETLVQLWRKARYKPWKLEVNEVSNLVAFYEIIVEWRKNRKRELTRIRNERARKKLQDAAKKGDSQAVTKLDSIKKADALKSAKYRKIKRKLRDKTRKGDMEYKTGGV